MKQFCAIALLLGMAAVITAEEKPTSLSDARAAIEANMRTPEGKLYDQTFGNDVLQHYIEGMRQCRQSAGGDSASFWLLVKLKQDGSVREVLLAPATKIGSCDRELLLKSKFTPPPHGDYWQGLYIEDGPLTRHSLLRLEKSCNTRSKREAPIRSWT